MHSKDQIFSLGRVVATRGVLKEFERSGEAPFEFLNRHQSGDWGSLEPEDKTANDYSLVHGSRILSAYMLKTGVKFWIITEADRSVTTLLLPSEY